MGFIFGGDTGETSESIKRKREIAEALMRRGATAMPQNLPEGLQAIAQAISGRMGINALDKREREGRAALSGEWDGYLKAMAAGKPAPDTSIGGFGGSDYSANGEGGDYFDNIRAAESGGNDSAKNPLSSATGRYQFTKGTWDDLARNNPDLGLTPDGRTDPNQQERAIRAFTKQNAGILAGAGIPATGGNLYAAHFLGPGGARSVLSQPDDASVAAIVGPDVVRANPFLQGMSVGDFKRWSAKKGGGDNVVLGGEEDDNLVDPMQVAGIKVGSPTSRLAGYGLDARTNKPISSPVGPPPAGREYFEGTALPQMPQQMALPGNAPMPTARPTIEQAFQAPAPQGRPQQQPAVDPMQTAAVPRPQAPASRMISQRADGAGYSYGPGGQYAPSGREAVVNALMKRGQTRPPLSPGLQAVAGALQARAGIAQAAEEPSMDARAMAILNSPYASDEQKAYVTAQLNQGLKQRDPEYQIDLDLKRAQLAKAQREATGEGGDETSLNVIYGYDDKGNPVAMQPTKSGKVVRSALPDGVTIAKDPIKVDTGTGTVLVDPITRQPIATLPKENYQEGYDSERGKAEGKAAGESASQLSSTRSTAELVSADIESLKTDPYLPNMVGAVNSRLPNVTEDAARVQSKIDKLQGGAFIQARGLLKGGGQITDFESKRAEQAFIRMNTAQNIDDFKDALDEFNVMVQSGLRKLEEQAQGSSRPMRSGGAATTTAPAAAPADQAPAGVDPEMWKFMTPEERALWQS